MVNVTPCEIGNYGKFRQFFLKCVEVGNIDAVYYEGLHRSTSLGVEVGIKFLEPNVPTHGLSTLVVGIFYVCIGEDMKASHVFQQFAVNHVDLRSDAIFEMGDELESRLSSFHVRYLNSHDATFKFPDNDVIKTPRCLYGHDYMVDFEGICKNCRLFWICFNISHML